MALGWRSHKGIYTVSVGPYAMADAYPFQFSSGEVKIWQVNVSACFFLSAIKPEMLEYAHMSLAGNNPLQHKQNLK